MAQVIAVTLLSPAVNILSPARPCPPLALAARRCYLSASKRMGFRTITPSEFAERQRRGDELLLVDVREPEEYELARVEGARLLPLSLFNEWAPSLDRERETVFICHHGIRSAQVCAFLSRQGFTRIYNLAGGIDRWSKEIDPSVPRY